MLELDITTLVFIVAAGFVAAFFDAAVGGGGAIAVPALLATGLSTTTALGTNKLAGTMGTLTSTLTFIRYGKVDKPLVRVYFPFSLLGSAFGVWAVQQIAADVLRPFIVGLLIVVSLFTVARKDWGTVSQPRRATAKTVMLMTPVFLGISFYDGFFGPGTGALLIFSFLFFGFNFVEAAGNAKTINFGSNLAALLLFAYWGDVHVGYGLPMGLAMIVGAAVGARFAIRKGSGYVKLLYLLSIAFLVGREIVAMI